ncbi:MAG: hypothetical protein ABI605_11085 [Rhizobacter sp.]
MTSPPLSVLIGVVHPPSPMQQAHGWYPLPGGRLGLRDTGFEIHFCSRPNCHPFHLVDPEGRGLTSSQLLQPLKQLAEQCAGDRAEFGF